jgi:malate dehydrogenase (oxaloacetate-decarboxylating)
MKDIRILMYGSGTAGTGIADQVSDAIAVESDMSKEEALKQIFCVDKPGLLLESMKDHLTPAQQPYARKDSEWEGKKHDDLVEIMREVKPHILIGTSTKPKAFTEQVIKEMAKHVERPIVFPLSNPTQLHEADPADIFKWTEGKALMATGSPFDPVEYKGTKYEVAECNNSTTFPGIGLGAILSRTKLMSPPLLVAATKALAAQAPSLKDDNAGLLPDVTNVREISVKIAAAVIRKAQEEKLAQAEGIPEDDDDLEQWIRAQMWDAQYRTLEKVHHSQATREGKGKAGTKGEST